MDKYEFAFTYDKGWAEGYNRGWDDAMAVVLSGTTGWRRDESQGEIVQGGPYERG